MLPEEPEVVLPLERSTGPLTPLVPAAALFSVRDPLDVEVPVPLENVISPPVAVPAPPFSAIEPPTPSVPDDAPPFS
jgi:hypothetical protein